MLGRSSSVIRGGIKRNAGADGCYRGEEAGRMAARRRARPKERALDADPVLRSRVVSDLARGRTPRQISGRLKARSAWQGGAPCAGSPAADGRTISHEATVHVDPHAIPMKNLVGARDRAALTAVGAQEGPRRRVVSPRSWACG